MIGGIRQMNVLRITPHCGHCIWTLQNNVEGRIAMCTVYQSDLQGLYIRGKALDVITTTTMVWYSKED